MYVFKQLPASGQLSLFLQAHERSSLLGDEDKILSLCCSMKLDILLIQLYFNWMVLKWKILWRQWWSRKCFFINFKKILPILISKFWLNDGLSQIMFQLLFLLVFTSVSAYDIDILYPLSCNDFCITALLSRNSSLWQDNSDNLLFVTFTRSFMTFEGWFTFTFMQRGTLLGFLNGKNLPIARLNVTSRKMGFN